MKEKKPNKLRNSLKQKLSVRLVIAAGVSVAMIAAGIFIYLQLSKTEPINAAASSTISQDNLPVDMVVDQFVVVSPDTTMRNGNRYKVAKPLSLTPSISK